MSEPHDVWPLAPTASRAAVAGLEELLPEVEELARRYSGALSRIEGAEAARSGEDPRPSNHGGHTPTPTPPEETD